MLKNLPSIMPSHPNELQYCFSLDAEDVAEEGVWYTFNRNLEACFKTHAIPAGGTIVFQERGPHLEALIQTFNTTARGLTSDAD